MAEIKERIFLRDPNQRIIRKYPWVKKHLNVDYMISPSYFDQLKELSEIDQGGFDHGDLSNLYVELQTTPRYGSTRLFGWKCLLNIALSSMPSDNRFVDGVIVDFLAGGGTLAKRLKQLIKNSRIKVLGLDVSKKMCDNAFHLDEIVFWAGHRIPLFKEANATIAAYGFHHVPPIERAAFVHSMKKILKKDGICIIHDFEIESSTARWYSEIIHNYRSCGHPYLHVSKESLMSLLGTDFSRIEIRTIYDPFYLEGVENQDEQSLKKEFYCYLISLFNLRKLLPNNLDFKELIHYNNEDFWTKIERLFEPYFVLNDRQIQDINEDAVNCTVENLKHIHVPLCNRLTIHHLSQNRLCLIAPRAALVGIGYNS